MCSKSDNYGRHGCTKSISIGEKGSKLSRLFLRTYSPISMPVCSAREQGKHVYKRRKLHGSSSVLLSEEDSPGTRHNISGHALKSNTDLRSQIESVQFSAFCTISSVREDGKCAQLLANFYQYAFECHSAINVTSSLPKPTVVHDLASRKISGANSGKSSSFDDVITEPHIGHGLTLGSVEHASTSTKVSVANHGELSLFNDVLAEPLRMFTSLKELCIAVRKTHGLHGGDSTSTDFTSLKVMHDSHTVSLSCKSCGLSENPKKMLICDLCEEAFHESCFKCNVNVLPDSEWYCQPCFKKKRKIAQTVHKGESSEMGKSGQRTLYVESLLSLILKDVLAHTSKVRIGQEYQAEVPDWSGPTYE